MHGTFEELQGYRHGLRQAKSKDAVHALEVRAIARSDSSKFGESIVVAELYDVVCLVALER